MPISKSFDEFEQDERRWTRRLCHLLPLFSLTSITAIGSGLPFDAVILSGGTSQRTVEVKLREDVTPFSTILLDRWKWERLVKLDNPTFIAFCQQSLTAYVFDLTRAKPTSRTKWVETPKDYQHPDGPKDLVECVQLPKRDADHAIDLRSISPKHRRP